MRTMSCFRADADVPAASNADWEPVQLERQAAAAERPEDPAKPPGS
jgi:hypothetical protein